MLSLGLHFCASNVGHFDFDCWLFFYSANALMHGPTWPP